MEKMYISIKRPDGSCQTRQIEISSRKNLFSLIRRHFSDMKFIIDKKYGAEISEIGGLKKSSYQGIHFTINGMVPWVVDQKTGKKLYLSLYHITATPQNLAGAHLVLELVSASCDFAGSVVDARLEFRTESFYLESLAPLTFSIKQASEFDGIRLDYSKLRFLYDLAFARLKQENQTPTLKLRIFSASQQMLVANQAFGSEHFFDKLPPPNDEIFEESQPHKPYALYPEPKSIQPTQEHSKIKAVIFDLDGVVVDSEKAHLKSFNQFLSQFGIKISQERWRKYYTGIGSVKIFEDICKRHRLKQDIKKLVQKRAKIYYGYIKKYGLPAIRGFKEFHSFLEKHKIKMIVASGGHRQHIKASLASIGLARMKFVGLEDVVHPKPNPEIFLLAAKKLKVIPQECLVIEDSLSGIKAAKAAGMRVIALSTTLPSAQLKGKADAVFKDFRSKSLRKLILLLAGLVYSKRLARKRSASANT
ncbi:MAG: HAD family phosphatase [Candidatus Anstonellaceae archaeon]